MTSQLNWSGRAVNPIKAYPRGDTWDRDIKPPLCAGVLLDVTTRDAGNTYNEQDGTYNLRSGLPISKMNTTSRTHCTTGNGTGFEGLLYGDLQISKDRTDQIAATIIVGGRVIDANLLPCASDVLTVIKASTRWSANGWVDIND